MRTLIAAIALLAASMSAQTSSTGAGAWTGPGFTIGVPGQGAPIVVGENVYCPASLGVEKTEQISPLWGASDDVATLPQKCMNTAMTSTPTGVRLPGQGTAQTFTPATNAFLQNVLGSANGGTGVLITGATGGTLHLSCGDAIVINAGSTYTGPFVFPAMGCDGGHWTFVRTSAYTSDAVKDPNFPAEGVRATPCLANIANDATHGRNLPGYPDYSCPSFGSTLTAKIVTATLNSPAIQFQANADHYRFIGIEATKTFNVRLGDGVIDTYVDTTTMGSNHIIFDRSLIHGEPWTVASGTASETQGGIRAKNSQWIALINSWAFDTYCISACVDSQAFAAGSGKYQDGPFKIYGNVMASAGETIFFGGGGQGAAGTPSSTNIEIRNNYLLKPLTWMVPVDSCSLQPDGTPGLNNVVPKNLSELKAGNQILYEANYLENSWQGCQSDQSGFAFLAGPGNQNNHQDQIVKFDGTAVVRLDGPAWSSSTTYVPDDVVSFGGRGYRSLKTANLNKQPDTNPTFWGVQSFSFSNGTPGDPSYCPVGGCRLGITDTLRADNGVNYFFCNTTNGCDQTGMDQVTTARIVATPTLPAAGFAAANSCVPGDCPTCFVKSITYRYNEIYNTTNGFQINFGTSSVCHDIAAGNDHLSVHDNLIHGCSVEMSNGTDPYSQCEAHLVSSNSEVPISSVSIFHETVGIELSGAGGGGLGQQVERSDTKYLSGLNIHDNLSPGPWVVASGSGSDVTNGVNNLSGLANVYQTDACMAYYPVEAPGGIVVPGQHSTFTFSPALNNYFVTLNGKYRAINGGSTTTGFTLTSAAADGNAITVRDLNTCNWIFRGNLLGTGLPGTGSDFSPYPASNDTSCGISGTKACILDGFSFTSLLGDWGVGRTGDFSFTGPNSTAYLGSASDAATRSATGKNPGADITALNTLLTGVNGTVFYPALSITTTSLTGNLDLPSPAVKLQASAGASPFKAWFLETTPASWSSGTTYAKGDKATFSSIAYLSLQNGNTNHQPPNGTWWSQLCGGTNCGTLAPGVVIGRGGAVNGPFAVQTVALTSNVAKITIQQKLVAGANSWTAGQLVTLQNFCIDSGNLCTGNQAADAAFNGTWSVVASGANCTNSVNVVCLALTHADITSHSPGSKLSNCIGACNNPAATFAPTAVGQFTWWMGVHDGAFQVARASIQLNVLHYVNLAWAASAATGTNGCCTYKIYRTTTSGSYGAALATTALNATTYTDTTPASGTTYFYAISSVDSSGEGVKSSETTAVIP